MEALTTDHVSVLCQAAINLSGGQAHLGGAQMQPSQGAEVAAVPAPLSPEQKSS